MSRESCALSGRRAFTLIELLVVLLIIAVIIAIVLPALGSVRSRARATTTQQQLVGITTAAGVFFNDNRRQPGHFTARDMAAASNATRGFSAMQNVMLDLAGGVVADGNAPMPMTGDIQVGPGTSPAQMVWVRPDLLGTASAGSKSYYIPDAKHWVAQDSAGQMVAVAEHRQLPSVVDDFRNPILAWVQDESAVGQITQATDFARGQITNNSDPSARFYWQSNSAFLGATAFGARATNQIGGEGSIIGANGSNAPGNAAESLCGLLGSPAYPYRDPAGGSTAPAVPAAPRGAFMVHSTGPDGIFIGNKDRGAKQFDLVTTPYINYQINFVNKANGNETTAADIYTDKDGKREIIDIVKRFDDILVSGGN